MRLSDKLQQLPISPDDVHRERARSPHARQLCPGSMAQVMEDAADSVLCPRCKKEFTDFPIQKNRDRRHPIVPSHMADPAGRLEVQVADARRRKSDTPRPF